MAINGLFIRIKEALYQRQKSKVLKVKNLSNRKHLIIKYLPPQKNLQMVYFFLEKDLEKRRKSFTFAAEKQ